MWTPDLMPTLLALLGFEVDTAGFDGHYPFILVKATDIAPCQDHEILLNEIKVSTPDLFFELGSCHSDILCLSLNEMRSFMTL